MAMDDEVPILSEDLVAEEVAVEDADEDVKDLEEGPSGRVRIKIYAKRWYILAVFSVLGLLQCMLWNSFGPISAAVLAVFCPVWKESTVALLGNWGNIMYLIPIVPVMWFFEVKGLRKSMTITAGAMFLGTLLRCIPTTHVQAFTVMSHLCAILNGVAGIVIFSAPSSLSSAWFPPGERTTATGIGLVFNNLGNAISFLAAPAIVPDPPNITTFDDDGCPILDDDVRDFIGHRIFVLMVLEAALVGACFFVVLAHFPSKPKLPPSVSSSMERIQYIPALKKIATSKKALLTTISFALFNGLIASWFSVINITFKDLPFGEGVDKDVTIGYIGLSAIIANSVSTIFISAIVDRLKGKMKMAIVTLMVIGILGWVWMCLLVLRVIPFSLVQLYASTIIASAVTYSTGPIFFEFTSEIVYPVPESVVGGFLTCIYNSIGMAFLFLFYIPSIASNPNWIPYAILSSTTLSLPLVLMVKEEYNRSRLDRNFDD